MSLSWTHKLGDQLRFLRSCLMAPESIPEQLKQLTFLPPLLSTFFGVICAKNSLSFQSSIRYHQSLHFPYGIDLIGQQGKELDFSRYQTKTYLPLIKLPVGFSTDIATARTHLLSQVGSTIRSIAKIPTSHFQGISYLFSELTDNIIEHAKADEGWITFQYFPSQGFLDLAIADGGQGVLSSLQGIEPFPSDFDKPTNDLEALSLAIKGLSSKKLAERGYGMHTSRSVLIHGMKGSFMLWSGRGLIFQEQAVDMKVDFPGTLILLRIPVSAFKDNFDLYQHVE